MTLVAQGSQLEQGESLVLLFSDQDNQASSITINGPSTSIEHFIPGKNLINLNLGKGQLYLVKKRQKSSIKDNFISVSAIEYYTPAIPVEVIE